MSACETPLLDGCSSAHLHEEAVAAAHRPRKLRLIAVIAIIYFNVSGGPLGSEQIISALGPAVGLSAICVFACVYSIPQAAVTAELSAAFPSNGGYSLWVQAAFGNFWGVQESYWSWFSGVVDSAIYPVLLYSTVKDLVTGWHMPDASGQACLSDSSSGGSDEDGDDDVPGRNLLLCLLEPGSGCPQEYCIKLGILALFFIPNMISSKVVGDFLTGLGLLSLLPFAVLVAVGIPKMNWANLVRRSRRPTSWSVGLSTLYWNMSGFDCASTFAGEVADSGTTYPRALFASVGVVIVCYVLPLFVAAGADPDWDCWTDGSLVSSALTICGSAWLAAWITGSSALSNWGLFAAELLEDSYQLLGMAEMGLAPRIFARTSRVTGTPLNAMFLQFIIIGLLVAFDFNAILCIDNFFASSASILEFFAIVRLRTSQPDLARPYRIPLSTASLAAFLVLPTLTAAFVCYTTATDSLGSAITIGVALLGGVAIYLPFVLSPKEVLDFERLSARSLDESLIGDKAASRAHGVPPASSSREGPRAGLYAACAGPAAYESGLGEGGGPAGEAGRAPDAAS